MKTCRLKITQEHFDKLYKHLFPGDRDEHGAVLKAGLVQDGEETILVVREVHRAVEGLDYKPGRDAHRILDAGFIHHHIVACRDERLVYLAVHNHGTDKYVNFSDIDMNSHERGYPALRDIAAGMPVGALVLGLNSVQADIWMPDGERMSLEEATIIGPTIRRLYPRPPTPVNTEGHAPFDRQVRLFGSEGQRILSKAKVGIVGLGGIGSLVSEYLSRLGVGELVLVDLDHIEASNLSRVVGATLADVEAKTTKVEIARRVAALACPAPQVTAIVDDYARDEVAMRLRTCDFIFMAADSMRARLVFNATVHQYLVPGAQLGAKVSQQDDDLQAFSAARSVRPGDGCLWCNGLIDPTELALESKSDEERKAQAYGVSEPNPSVITLNAVAAAHGINEFLFDFLGIRERRDHVEYLHLGAVQSAGGRVKPRRASDCPECATNGPRFGRGDASELPTFT